MDIENMTDDELNARFDRVFASTRQVRDVYAPTFRQRWAEATFITKLAAILTVGFVLPWTILLGGIICLVIWDQFV